MSSSWDGDADDATRDDEQMETPSCPLCMEELDLTDLSFHPCKCGYQICLWCYQQLSDAVDAKCPACRSPFVQLAGGSVVAPQSVLAAAHAHATLAQNAARLQGKKKSANANKERQTAIPTAGPSRDMSGQMVPIEGAGLTALSEVRVVQRNLAYIVGLSSACGREDLLRKKEWLGFGKTQKVAVAKSFGSGSGPQANVPTFAAYVTYRDRADAAEAIKMVNFGPLGLLLAKGGQGAGGTGDGEPPRARASFGTTKYCAAWLKGQPCTKNNCLYLHAMASLADCCTKDQLQRDRFDERFGLGKKNLAAQAAAAASSSSSSSSVPAALPQPEMIRSASTPASFGSGATVAQPRPLSFATMVAQQQSAAAAAAVSQSGGGSSSNHASQSSSTEPAPSPPPTVDDFPPLGGSPSLAHKTDVSPAKSPAPAFVSQIPAPAPVEPEEPEEEEQPEEQEEEEQPDEEEPQDEAEAEQEPEPEQLRAETPEPPQPTPQQSEADQKALQLLFSRPAHPISSLQPSPPATPLAASSSVTLSSILPSASPSSSVLGGAKPIRPPPGFRDIAKPLSSPPGFGAPPGMLSSVSALPLQNAPVVHSFTAAAALPSAAPSNLFANAGGSSSALPLSVSPFASATLTDPNADSWEQRWDVSGASSGVNGLGSNGHLRDSQLQQQSDHQLPWLQSGLQQMGFGDHSQQHRQQLNGLGVPRQQEQSAAQAYQLSARAALIQNQGAQNALPRGLVNMIPAPSDSPQQQQQQAPSQPQWQPQTMAPRFQSMTMSAHAPLQMHQQMVQMQQQRQQEEQQRQQQQQQQQQQQMQAFQQQQQQLSSRHTPPLASGSSTPQDSPMKSQQGGGSRYRFAEEGQQQQQSQQSHLFQRNLFESASGPRFEDHQRVVQQQQQWDPQPQQQQQHLHGDYQQVQSRYAQPVSPPRANQAGHFGNQGGMQQFGAGPQQQMQYGSQQDRELDFMRVQQQQQQQQREQQHQQQQQQLPPHQQLHQSLSQQALPVSHYAPSVPPQPPFGHGAPPGSGPHPPHPQGPMRHPRPPMSSNSSSHSAFNLKGKARPHDSNEGEQRTAQQETHNNNNISSNNDWTDRTFEGDIIQQGTAQHHHHHHLLFRPDSPDDDDLLLQRVMAHSAHIGDSQSNHNNTQHNNNNHTFTPFSGGMQMAHALQSAATQPLSTSSAFTHLSPPSSRRASDSFPSDLVPASSDPVVAPPPEEPTAVVEPSKPSAAVPPPVVAQRLAAPAVVPTAAATVAPPAAAAKQTAPKPSPSKKPVAAAPPVKAAAAPTSVKTPASAAAKPLAAVVAAAAPAPRPAVAAAKPAAAVPSAAAVVSASAPVTPQRKGRASAAAAATPTPRASPGAASQAKVPVAVANAPVPKAAAKTVAASAVVPEKTVPAAAASVRAAPATVPASAVAPVVSVSKAEAAAPASPSKLATHSKENSHIHDKPVVVAPAPAPAVMAPTPQKKAGGKKGRRVPVPQNRPATPPPPPAPAPVPEPVAEDKLAPVPVIAVAPSAKPAKKKAQKQSKQQQQQQQQSQSKAAAKSSAAAGARGGGYVLSTTSVPVAPDAPIFLSDSVSPAALASAMASHALPYANAAAALADRTLAHRQLWPASSSLSGSSPLPLSVDDFAEVHRELLGLARLVRAGSLPPLELQAVLANLVEAQVPNLPSWEKLLAMEELATDEEGGTEGSKIEQQVAEQVDRQLEEHAAAAEKSAATASATADVAPVATFTYPSLLALRFDSTLSLHYDERYRAWEQSSSFSRDLCKEVYVLSQTLSAQKRRLRESKKIFEAARDELEDMLLGGAGAGPELEEDAEIDEEADHHPSASLDSAPSDDDAELRDLSDASASFGASSAGSSSRSHHRDGDATLSSSSCRSTVVSSSVSPPTSEGTNSNSSTLSASLMLSPEMQHCARHGEHEGATNDVEAD